jgi:tetratricopeptide (TPR) repeat protein
MRYAMIILLVLPLLVYLPALKLGFVYFDDDILILDNAQKLSDLSNLGQAFRTDAFFSDMSPYYRPMMNVSFFIDAALGSKNPVISHLMNILLHLLTVAVLFRLLELLKFSRTKAFTGSFIFALHPVMGHAVLWIPARGDLLVTLFGLLSFFFFIRFVQEKQRWMAIGHIAAFAAALFSKESAVLFPLLFILFLALSRLKVLTKNNLILALSWTGVLIGWLLLRASAIHPRGDAQSGLDSLLRNWPFLPESVARLLFPFDLPVTPVFSWWYTIAGIGASALLLYWIFGKQGKQYRPLILFGALWFAGFCLPNMFVRLASADDNFEYLLHRLYLPGIGFLMGILGLIPDAWTDLRTRPYNMVLGFLMLPLIAFSLIQQRTYRDGVTYWGSATEYRPTRAWFHYYLGRYYFKQQDYTSFGKYLAIADSLKSYPEFRYHLGMVYLTEKKEYDKAYGYFTSAMAMGYTNPEVKKNFVTLCVESSAARYQMGDLNGAVERCREALLVDPTNSVAAYNLGIYLVNSGEKQQAASMWKKALSLNPDLTDAYKSLCYYYQYDVKKADSAARYEREYKNHGGTGSLISP